MHLTVSQLTFDSGVALYAQIDAEQFALDVSNAENKDYSQRIEQIYT